jgi:hypothetical protein
LEKCRRPCRDRRLFWGIPPAEITELGGLAAAADTALSRAMSSERTHTVTVACRLSFEALDGKMRFFKSQYFLVPPLTPIDLARLGLAEQNPANPIPRPDAQPIADLAFPGIRLVELRNIRPVAGPSTDPRSGCRVVVRYGLTGTPTDSHRIRVSGAPLSGKDLPETLSTRRKKELFDFDIEQDFKQPWFVGGVEPFPAFFDDGDRERPAVQGPKLCFSDAVQLEDRMFPACAA